MVQVLGAQNTGLQPQKDDDEYDGGGDNDVDSYANDDPDAAAYWDEEFVGRRFLLMV